MAAKISAFMPVKCMRLIPSPMTAPPRSTCMREPNEAMEKPAVVAVMAMTNDAAVKPGSYAVGRLSSYASMATKCVAQMPLAAHTPVTSSHKERMGWRACATRE